MTEALLTTETSVSGRRSVTRVVDSAPRTTPVVGGLVLAVSVIVGAFAAGSGVEYTGEFLVAVLAAPLTIALGVTAVVRFEWFVWVCIIVRPSLDIAGSDGIGPGAMMAAAFTSVSMIWLFVQYRSRDWTRWTASSWSLAAFTVAVVMSVATSQLLGASARSAIEIFSGLSMFLVLEQLLANRRDRVRSLITAIIAGSVVPVTVGIIQWMTGDFVGSRTDVERIRGTFIHPNPYATYLVLVILLVAALIGVTSGRLRVVLSSYLVVMCLVLVVTYNRSGWLALIVGGVYLGARFARWTLAALAIGAVVVVLAVPGVGDRLSDLGGQEDYAYLPSGVPDNSYEWRLQYWESLIPLANDSPLTGIGPQVVVNTQREALEPHNVFVQTYVEMGVLGLGTLLCVIWFMGRQLSQRRRAATSEIDRALATGGVAMGLAILVMAPSENLLNQTMAWWFLGACAVWGWQMNGPPARTATEHAPFDRSESAASAAPDRR